MCSIVFTTPKNHTFDTKTKSLSSFLAIWWFGVTPAGGPKAQTSNVIFNLNIEVSAKSFRIGQFEPQSAHLTNFQLSRSTVHLNLVI